MEESTIALFRYLDDFAQVFQVWECHNKLIGLERQRIRAGILSSERCCSTPVLILTRMRIMDKDARVRRQHLSRDALSGDK